MNPSEAESSTPADAQPTDDLRYVVRSTHGVHAGRGAAAKQVLLGPFGPDLLVFFFDEDGVVLSKECRRGLATDLESVCNELILREEPIQVRAFRDEEHGIGVRNLPSHLEDTSWAEDAEELAEIEEDKAAWIQRGDFVFRWAGDYYMNRDGEVQAT